MSYRTLMNILAAAVVLAGTDAPCEEADLETADPNLWLEGVLDANALNWVRRQNSISTKELEASPNFEPIRKRLLAILDSKDKIPYVEKKGRWYYNFWRDDQHVRGLWRRTSFDEYRKLQPEWETVLDLDRLALEESENWVWKGADVLFPAYDRCLVFLSRGGADAVVVREFDLLKKQFSKDGFELPEAKSDTAWKDRDTLYVGTDFGEGSLTTSGYPRIIKEWKRGTPLTAARQIFEGQAEDVRVSVTVVHDDLHPYEFISRIPSFFTLSSSFSNR